MVNAEYIARRLKELQAEDRAKRQEADEEYNALDREIDWLHVILVLLAVPAVIAVVAMMWRIAIRAVFG